MKFLSLAIAAASAATASAFAAKAGDKLPSAKLFQGFGAEGLPKLIDTAEYAKGKNMIIVGLPGAFTPT